jgi:hypothetical protein
MKTGKRNVKVGNDLFPELDITINPELNNVNKSGSLKKITAAKKILSNVKFPPYLGANT